MENGVLNILLPKKERIVTEPKVRQIEVQFAVVSRTIWDCLSNHLKQFYLEDER